MAFVLLALVVAVLLLAISKTRRDPWGPEADEPCGYQLTDRGHQVLDEES